jgi:uroporphyrinogen decarboxylase
MAAIKGGPIDRPPCTAWVHFATDRLGGSKHAQRHARFVRDNDWDICKVVNDFRYPAPEGMETLTSEADIRRFGRAPMSSENFAEELKCIRLLRAEFGADMPIMITGFDPFQQVLRRVGYSRAPLIYANRDAALTMLDAVCDSMCEYMGLVRDAGCDAVFFSVNSAICPPQTRGVNEEVFRTFLRPFEIRMLEAMAGMVRVLHIHGTSLDVRRVLDYPVEAVSVSDRLAGNPSLRELRAMTDKCLMGGVNETAISERSLPEMREEVFDCTRQIGREKFILSPGCTIPTQTPWYLLRAIRDTCEKL